MTYHPDPACRRAAVRDFERGIKLMTVEQAVKKWKLSKNKVYDVCRILRIEKDSSGRFIIPDIKTPYYPDFRAFKIINPLHVYIYTLDAIIAEKLIIPELIKTDNEHIRTAVRELKARDVIVVLDGHENDNNYLNYMISMGYSDWQTHSIKEKLEIIKDITAIGNDVRNIVKI